MCLDAQKHVVNPLLTSSSTIALRVLPDDLVAVFRGTRGIPRPKVRGRAMPTVRIASYYQIQKELTNFRRLLTQVRLRQRHTNSHEAANL